VKANAPGNQWGESVIVGVVRDWCRAAVIYWLVRYSCKGKVWLPLTTRNMSSLWPQRKGRRLPQIALRAADVKKRARKW
jgi:hypothetical protein